MNHILLRLIMMMALCAPLVSQAQRMPDVRGFYAGFTGIVSPDEIGPAELEVMFQNGRRFHGSLRGVVAPEDIPIDGTVSASGIVNIVGKVRENTTLVAHGKVREIGGGATELSQLALMYQINGPGVHVRGILIGMRMFGGADWNTLAGADVTGPYTGELRSGVGPSCMPAIAYLQNLKDTTGVTGDLGISGSPLTQDGSVRFRLRGTVAAIVSPFDSPIQLLGVDANTGIVGILIGLRSIVSPNDITGEYRLYDSFFDVFFDIYHGVDMSTYRGMFELLPYVAPPPIDR